MAAILVIDDSEPMREYLRFILEEEGYQVETAENGEQGLTLFKAKKFRVVITDIAMPKKDGIETLIEIKRLDNAIKVIVISGAERSKVLLEIAGIFNADAMIMKPFTREAVSFAVQEVMGGIEVESRDSKVIKAAASQ